MTDTTTIRAAAHALAEALGVSPWALAGQLTEGFAPLESVKALAPLMEPNPSFVGRVDRVLRLDYVPGTRRFEEADHDGPVSKAAAVSFAGMRFDNWHCDGQNLHDGRPVWQFGPNDDTDEEPVWIDAAGNVYADCQGSVQRLRALFNASQKPAKRARAAKVAA